MKITHIASPEERLAARQGVSVFLQHDGKEFHTYSACGVGAAVMLSSYRFLDLAPLDRQRYQRMAVARHVRGTGSS